MGASWAVDLTVTEAVDAVVDEETPENNAPARIVATSPNAALIAESSPWLAAELVLTVTMADGAPLPATIGQTVVIRSRVT